jgi:Protein of unknown function (DUF4007)
MEGSTVDFNHLLSGEHQIGSVFLLNAEQLHNYLTQLTEKYPFLILTENAGKRILQVKSENDPTQFITQ